MYKIGFCCEEIESAAVPAAPVEAPRSIAPRKSVVQVSFPGYGRSLAYYNDKFDLRVGDMVSNLTCSCFCSCSCKHEFAAMLQLRETLGMIGRHYAGKYNDYFAAVLKGTLFTVSVDGKETGSFTL